MEKAKYLIELYCDESHTLFQAIKIGLFLNEQSNGMEAEFWRGRINPNLNILYKRLWLDEKNKLIKQELLEGN